MARRPRIAALSILAPLLAWAAVAQPASAHHYDLLLAPEPACPGQSDTSLAIGAQLQTMQCMHAYARTLAAAPAIQSAKPLRVSSKRKARDIRRCQEFSHTACGRNAFYWVKRTGFLNGSAGVAEILALGSGVQGSVRQTMSGWLHSDLHRPQLLAPNYLVLGIGMVQGRYRRSTGVQFWVAHYGYRN